MGGKDGIRGYLVQSVIVVLESFDDSSWTKVTIESDEESDKVDIHWERPSSEKVVQVKSSKNQIGKADAERWATELKKSTTADEYELLLVGPCAQTVAQMGAYSGVKIPCPRTLDLEGLLGQAAHLLDKLLLNEGLNRQSPYQREIMVGALTTHISLNSAAAKPLSRIELIALVKAWISSITSPVDSVWELVDFSTQRSIESAIAGIRLGPADVKACPKLSIASDIYSELEKSHLHEVVGTAGCGKSITAWHVAKQFFDAGYSIWRPSPSSNSDALIDGLPTVENKVLIVDDAQRFGSRFADRIAELACAETKVLLVATVDDPLSSNVLCISAPRCVAELKAAIGSRRAEVLPLLQRHDDSVGDRYHETSFENRLYQSGLEKSPWEFFWILRGGWRTAGRELESLKQFPHANDAISIIAAGQVLTCDAGVSYDWIRDHALSAGIDDNSLNKALHYLASLSLTITSEAIRAKHISYARIVLERSLSAKDFESWSSLIPILVRALADKSASLKGVCWLLGVVTRTDAFRWKEGEEFRPLLVSLAERCVRGNEDIDWAAGCLSRIFEALSYSCDEILAHRSLLHRWITSGSDLAAYFCSNIVNSLINNANRDESSRARDVVQAFIEEVDHQELAATANKLKLDDFHSFGSLLNRLAYFRPSWGCKFVEQIDWPKLRGVILRCHVDHAFAVDKFVASICSLARKDDVEDLSFVEDISIYLARAINDRPCDAIHEMHDIFWLCLGYAPRFLRGGHSQDANQERVARSVVDLLQPQVFSEALSRAIPRDLENMARSLEVVHDVDPQFTSQIAQHLNRPEFFNATRDDWRNQSSELNNLIRFFCIGKTLEPARSWVEEMQGTIEPPLTTLFVAIAPRVAIDFVKSAKCIEIVNVQSPQWNETNLAIMHLAELDNSSCLEAVKAQLTNLRGAFYELNLSSTRHMVAFLRILHKLSTHLFEEFVAGIDLDDARAAETIQRLARNQEKERVEYLKLARLGRRFEGRLGELANGFISRLQKASEGKPTTN